MIPGGRSHICSQAIVSSFFQVQVNRGLGQHEKTASLVIMIIFTVELCIQGFAMVRDSLPSFRVVPDKASRSEQFPTFGPQPDHVSRLSLWQYCLPSVRSVTRIETHLTISTSTRDQSHSGNLAKHCDRLA